MGELLKDVMGRLSRESPDFKKALNLLLKYEISNLLQRLSDNGEESVVITASVADGIKSHLGSSKGEDFVKSTHHVDVVKEQFLQYCTGMSKTSATPLPLLTEPIVIKTEPLDDFPPSETMPGSPCHHTPSKQSRLIDQPSTTPQKQPQAASQFVGSHSTSAVSATTSNADTGVLVSQSRLSDQRFNGSSAAPSSSGSSLGIPSNLLTEVSFTPRSESSRADNRQSQVREPRVVSPEGDSHPHSAASPESQYRPSSSGSVKPAVNPSLPFSSPSPRSKLDLTSDDRRVSPGFGSTSSAKRKPANAHTQRWLSQSSMTSNQGVISNQNTQIGSRNPSHSLYSQETQVDHDRVIGSQNPALGPYSQETQIDSDRVIGSRNSALGPYSQETQMDSDMEIEEPTPPTDGGSSLKQTATINLTEAQDDRRQLSKDSLTPETGSVGSERKSPLSTPSKNSSSNNVPEATLSGKAGVSSYHGNREVVDKGNVLYRCGRCGGVFESQHKRDVHEGLYCGASPNSNGPYACDICGVEFTDESLYHQHRYIVHVSSHRKNPRYDDKRSDSDMLKGQDDDDDDDTVINSMYRSSQHSFSHFKRSPSNRWRHKQGGHMKGKGTEVTSSEGVSHYGYGSGTTFQTMSPSGGCVKPFVCSHCGKGFNAKRYLQAHLDLHDTTVRHQCPFCSVSYPQKNSLRKHITRKHPPKQDFDIPIMVKHSAKPEDFESSQTSEHSQM